MSQLQQKARGTRPQYFEDPAVDRLLSITLALAGEVAVLHDQLDTTLRLTEAGTPLTRTAVADYVPDAAVRAERDTWRDGFLDIVLRAVHQEREGLEQAAEQTDYAAAITAVELDTVDNQR